MTVDGDLLEACHNQDQRPNQLVLKPIIAAAIVVVAADPVIASQQTDVMAPVRQFIDGFNKGDIKMAQAACAD